MSGLYIPMNRRDLLFVDCETSGLEPTVQEILELAAVRVTHDFSREVGSFERKCRMQHPELAESKALEINRYSAEEWKYADPILLALVDYTDLVGDNECIVVGQNPSFDVGFLKEAFKREGIPYPNTKYLLDTASIAWSLCVRGHIDRINLETICKAYDIPNDGSHRAMADVRRTMAAYRHLLGLAA